MKLNKIFVATTILAASSMASADVVGVYASAQKWNYDIDGYVSSGSGNIDFNDDLGYDDNDNNSYFVALEHPVPVLPNIKIQQNHLEGNAVGTASKDITFNTRTFPEGMDIVSSYDFSNTDYTLYYEILDNWVNLDLGITGKDFDGYVLMEYPPGIGSIPNNGRVNFKGIVPMLYGKAQFDLPLTGFNVGTTMNIGQTTDDKINDYTMYFGYEGETGFGFEVGYRNFTVEFDDFDDLSTDFTFDGYYASLNFHF